jgi:hypothetical protein
MRIIPHTLTALVCLALLGGCNDAKSPAEVQKNVADAQQSAAKDVAGETKDARKAASDSAYDVAIAKAEGNSKVAMEKCEALNGDSQKACKDQADAALKLDRANAEAEHVRTTT